MRKPLLFALLLPLIASAQPGPDVLFLDPCGSASYGVPLQNVARNDVQVSTYGVNTNNIPNNSKNYLHNMITYEHAQFLHTFNPKTKN